MTVKRLFAIMFIFLCTFAAWMILGGVTTVRSEDHSSIAQIDSFDLTINTEQSLQNSIQDLL